MDRISHTTFFPRPGLGISACLLGDPVRYDGGHKRHTFLADVLARHVDCVPLCPETGIGMGVPRPPIHLVGEPGQPHALGVQDPSLDVTARLEQFATAHVDELRCISGYLFKKDSPSCGLHRVKLFASPGGHMQRRGTGIFAAAVRAALPLLPVEQEDALDDPLRRDSFISRLYVYRRWQLLQENGLDRAALQAFHRAHSHLLMAHSHTACQRLEQLLASPSAGELPGLADCYIRELLATLARPTSRARHHAVQLELAKHLKPQLDHPQWTTLMTQLQAYRDGELPLRRAISVLRILFEQCAPNSVPGHTYLHPYPDSLQYGT